MSEKVVVEYRLVSEHGSRELGVEVTELLKRGWELYEAPSMVLTQGGTRFAQAVVRYAECADYGPGY